jgi:hypothetical protein
LLVMLLSVPAAFATPVEPDMKELLSEPPPPASQFAPARAGWYATETSRPAPNLELESFTAASTARAAKAALKAAAVPHPLALAGVLGMIFLLRRLRTLQPA